MRKLQEELKQKEERILFLSSKVDKNKMQDAEMAAEERRGRNASQTGDCCLEEFISLGANRIETFVQRFHRDMGTAQGQVPGREEGRRKQ